MNFGVKFLTCLYALFLTACATNPAGKQDLETVSSPDEISSLAHAPSNQNEQTPPTKIIIKGTTLFLVRIMDGGACKNDYQGVKGEFLLYADMKDIERIKTKQGAEVFADFEKKIQELSTSALEQAVEETNLAEDPFLLGADEAQQKLSKQLNANFQRSLAKPLREFIKETTLNIQINTFLPSLVFYQHGCEATVVEPEN